MDIIFELTIIVPPLDDAMIDALAGKCPDSGVGARGGTTFVDFDRQGESLGQAIDSALGDLAELGIRPFRVLVDVTQPA